MNQLEGKIYSELEQLRSKLKLMQDSLYKIDDLDALKVAAVESKNVRKFKSDSYRKILSSERHYNMSEILSGSWCKTIQISMR